jgi:hypothetical protein
LGQELAGFGIAVNNFLSSHIVGRPFAPRLDKRCTIGLHEGCSSS